MGNPQKQEEFKRVRKRRRKYNREEERSIGVRGIVVVVVVAEIRERVIGRIKAEVEPQRVSKAAKMTARNAKDEIKWRPAPGCEYAVDFTVASGNLMSPASAHIAFVGIVLKKAHRYVDCKTVAKWILKNSAESENKDW
ncbi:hypothetical protein J1N35_026863 [Gossypium stocksii]|uniref:Uncharacterized protein n=1 Tax=Gossypium stocksii TaxID=47602 RepID=A0A9D3ZXH4_9ROSI|nr:hypothetical protein J1N35_026863 [Gossypium stocksii]